MNKPYKTGYVAVVGRPNVGKSTLINQITQSGLSIVSHKPQTTRHQIKAIHTTAEYQVIFIDTPGIHKNNKNALNRKLNQTAMSSVYDVDCVVFIIDGLQWTEEDLQVCRLVNNLDIPVLLAVNKVDKIKDKERLLPHVDRVKKFIDYHSVYYISALKGKYIDQLMTAISEFLPESDAHYDAEQISTQPTKFFIAEMIREQVMHRYHEEIPYSVTVEVESFKAVKAVQHIHAIIWVERSQQKQIVIGKNGIAIKKVGTLSRQKIEDFLQCKVYLKLWVKVKASWTDDQKALDNLGYNDDL